MQEYISVQGCKVHNLKNIDVKIPRNKLVVITGISGVENLHLHLTQYMLKHKEDT